MQICGYDAGVQAVGGDTGGVVAVVEGTGVDYGGLFGVAVAFPEIRENLAWILIKAQSLD